MPRYVATSVMDDPADTVRLADELDGGSASGTVVLVQCGRASPLATEIGHLLARSARRPVNMVITERKQAQSERVVEQLTAATAVWVFAEDLSEAFTSVFATDLAFALRSGATSGVPVVGVGNGALALGGLLLANRVCMKARNALVPGLGWAPRVLLDGGPGRGILDRELARSSVRALPGLLGIDVGLHGGVRVQGWRVESVGAEPIQLFGTDDTGRLYSVALDPGQVTTVAPPPFAPFTRGLVPPQLLAAAKVHPTLTPSVQRPEVTTILPEVEPSHPEPTTGGVCPMCHKVHAPDPQVVLAA